MNPIAQRIMGIGAVIGFTATFAAGSPVTAEGALHLVTRALWAGVIFGVLGYVTGDILHRSISEIMQKEVEKLLLQKELRRQEKRRKVEEADQMLDVPGSEPGVEFTPELLEGPVIESEGPPPGGEPPPVEGELSSA